VKSYAINKSTPKLQNTRSNLKIQVGNTGKATCEEAIEYANE